MASKSSKRSRHHEAPSYPAPVAALMPIGNPSGTTDAAWFRVPIADYSAIGITPEHTGALLTLMRDERCNQSEPPVCYGPVHAARALASIGATSAIPSMLALVERLERHDDDGWLEDMQYVIAHFGEPALDPVARVVRDQRVSWAARLYLCGTLEELGLKHPSLRQRVIDVFTAVLAVAQWTPPVLIETTIGSLIELNAVEALPQIRRAYELGYVDEEDCGPLSDVEEEIQLTREERDHRRDARSEARAAERARLFGSSAPLGIDELGGVEAFDDDDIIDEPIDIFTRLGETPANAARNRSLPPAGPL